MYEINDFSKDQQFGWVCPKCGRVMAPQIIECLYCNKQFNTIIENPQYINTDYTKSVSITGENVQQVSKYGNVISPIKEE